MHHVTYQTVRLGRGKHSSPEKGACVMELASMIAGEPFTDHPHSVSRPIAAFLRTYNDTLDDERRQDLYEFASKCVGTAAPAAIEQLRAERLIEWADDVRRPGPWLIARRLRRRPRVDSREPNAAARYAIRAIRKINDETHHSVLSLVDELIELDAERPELEPRSREHLAIPELGGVS